MLRKYLSFVVVGSILLGTCGDLYGAGKKRVGVAWFGKSQMASRFYDGFNQKILEYKDRIEVDYRRELASEKELIAVLKEFMKTKDAIVVLRSKGAQVLASLKPSIPAFVGACSHPNLLKVTNDIKSPKGNITGVTYFLDYAKPFDYFTRVFPDIKKYVLLVKKGHPSSKVDVEMTIKQCNKRRLKCDYEYLENRLSLVKAMPGYIKSEKTAFIIGNQAHLILSAETILRLADGHPVVAFSEGAVKHGALLGFSPRSVWLGFMLAESVIDVVVENKKISETPVKFELNPTLSVNISTANKLGIKIPEDILRSAHFIH